MAIPSRWGDRTVVFMESRFDPREAFGVESKAETDTETEVVDSDSSDSEDHAHEVKTSYLHEDAELMQRTAPVLSTSTSVTPSRALQSDSRQLKSAFHASHDTGTVRTVVESSAQGWFARTVLFVPKGGVAGDVSKSALVSATCAPPPAPALPAVCGNDSEVKCDVTDSRPKSNVADAAASAADTENGDDASPAGSVAIAAALRSGAAVIDGGACRETGADAETGDETGLLGTGESVDRFAAAMFATVFVDKVIDDAMSKVARDMGSSSCDSTTSVALVHFVGSGVIFGVFL